jgi:hypothetical protein
MTAIFVPAKNPWGGNPQEEVESLRQKVRELEEGAKFFHEIENLKEQIAEEKQLRRDIEEFYAGAAIDAKRYRRFVAYMIGPRTDLDDAFVASTTKEEYDVIIDEETEND